VLKLIHHLPQASFDLQLHTVLITIVNTLLSKNVTIRTAARETLAKVRIVTGQTVLLRIMLSANKQAAVFLGPTHLYKILYEMKHQLTTGYKLHVRCDENLRGLNFTV
jgi:hypothetical protein